MVWYIKYDERRTERPLSVGKQKINQSDDKWKMR